MGLLRSGTLYIGCGVSVDTRVALGDDVSSRYDTLECGSAVSRPELVDDLRTGGGVGKPFSVL